MYPKKVIFFKCKGGDETVLLKVNILQLNGKKIWFHYWIKKKSVISIDLKTVIFEMGIDGFWGDRSG